MQLNALMLSGPLQFYVCVSVCLCVSEEDEMADPTQTFEVGTGAESEKKKMTTSNLPLSLH